MPDTAVATTTKLNTAEANTLPILQKDNIAAVMDRSWDELFGMDREEVEAFQLAAARQRFDELAPKVKMLKSRADSVEVSAIKSLDDIPGLLFDNLAFKSYPMSFLEKGRYDMLTKWLDGMTSLDLSGIDVSRCRSIDDWLDTLEAGAPLSIYHTTGTSGKLSFIPRTTLERDIWNHSFAKLFAGFGNEKGIKLGGKDGVRLPVIYPVARYGHYTAQYMGQFLAKEVAPTPDQCYMLSDDKLSAEIVSLSGRVRIAQAKGELGQMKLSEETRHALREYLLSIEQRAENMTAYFLRMAEKLKGQRVYISGVAGYFVQAGQAAMKQGLSHIFAPDSIAATGGGMKDAKVPDNWRDIIAEFTGITWSNWHLSYAMTEVTGQAPFCAHGHYHIPPYSISYLLDPETNQLLPRTGIQNGRYAVLDLLPQSFWAGIVSGDKITINFDGGCPCGRKGAYVYDPVERYAQNVSGGDDKITCSATVDNSDIELRKLLGF